MCRLPYSPDWPRCRAISINSLRLLLNSAATMAARWPAYCQEIWRVAAPRRAIGNEGRDMHVISPISAGSRRGLIFFFGLVLLGLAVSAGVPGSALAGGILRVAMTAGDVPVTTGNTDQGFEGMRFVGYNLYDSLLLWDLSKSDKPSDIRPGLATSYEIDPSNNKRWIVHLRQGVKFHDGCNFNADAVTWNFQVRSDQNAPGFSTQQFTLTRQYFTNIKAVSKVDDNTVAFDNNFVESLFPYTLSYIMMVSPCRVKELNNDWGQYALHPSGTGPYKFDQFVAHERLEFVPNTEYWDKDRVPKQDRLVLIPMPEASTRTAALLHWQ